MPEGDLINMREKQGNNHSLLGKILENARRNRILETLIIFTISFFVTYIALSLIKIEPVGLGESVVKPWCELHGVNGTLCIDQFNSHFTIVEQALSLTLFLTVIVLTAISMELRHLAAVFAISTLVFLGIVPPQELIMGVEWKLIVFLIGSMTFAFILRQLGVFRFIALTVLRVSKKSPLLFVSILSFISWFLSLAVGEATSIIYITMLLLDVKKITGKDIKPLVILAVLATNTGSLAMPVGNPIGIYLAFAVGLHASDFVYHALPLSLITLVSLIIVAYYLLRRNIEEVLSAVTSEKINIVLTEFYTKIEKKGRFPLIYGSILLIVFLVAISLSKNIADALSIIYGVNIDANALLAFIPYIFIFLSLEKYKPEKLEIVLLHGVEWPSLFFFIALFMLGYSLMWTGVAMKIAYFMGIISLGLGDLVLREALLAITATTSAFLDNLSVIVAFTPVAQSLVNIGISSSIYWALLFGGVLGGNFTPIGSTANIIAVGLCEKAKIKISWKEWLKLAFIATLLQVVIAGIWISI